MTRIRVGILFGGRSAEHEISILSARNVLAAMDRNRFDPVLVGIDRAGQWRLQPEAALLCAAQDPRRARLNAHGTTVAIEPQPRRVGHPGELPVDVVFPVLHGPMGEDGTVQGLLELAGIPYVGAGVLGSALGMDKHLMKCVLRDAGLAVADFRVVAKGHFERDPAGACRLAAEVGFPLFSKPANLGSSVGIRRVASAAALPTALAHALQFDLKAVVEAAVPGRELECAVLGNDEPVASVPGEVVVRHADGFYSYEAKYLDDGAELRIPASLEPALARRVQETAVRAFQVLDCAGMARVDFFLQPDGRLLVNEINTLPGFTRISMYPKLWEASGVGTSELVGRLVDLALERHRRRQELKTSYRFKRPVAAPRRLETLPPGAAPRCLE